MKNQITKLKISPSFYEKDVMYGMATMGARGQLVIPADARKDLKLAAGDRLVVMGKFGKVLSFMKAEDIEGIVARMMEHLEKGSGDERFEQHIKKQMAELRKFTK